MREDMLRELENGLSTAFIDESVSSNLAYKPQFISNNYKEGRKVLSSIEEELLACEQFCISVAFITTNGITPLLQTLKELEEKNIPGRILTTDYLNFSEPKALQKLEELKNIELRMFCVRESGMGFHTKGYIFEKDEMYRIIVGSSNMTLSALTKNKEWNTRIVSTNQGEYAREIVDEFESLWNSGFSKRYDEFIEDYKVKYELIKKQKAIAKQDEILSLEQYRLQPNKMQVRFIKNLKEILSAGERKALLISATGTGKTYASAFGVREENPKKILFLVHREQIAKQAITSYQKVFGKTKSFGLLSGHDKNYEADYLFCTMQMMAKEETLSRYSKDEFEIIVIDEVWHNRISQKKTDFEGFLTKFYFFDLLEVEM